VELFILKKLIATESEEQDQANISKQVHSFEKLRYN
jgi:hypothetical protein